jgi:hypothetical protein
MQWKLEETLRTCHNRNWHLLTNVVRIRRGRDVTATFHELRRALIIADDVHGRYGKVCPG